MSRILITTDFSENSIHAGNIAKQLAAKMNFKYDVIHCADDLTLLSRYVENRGEGIDFEKYKTQSEKELKKLFPESQNIFIKFENPTKAILSHLEKNAYEFLVVGFIGISFFEKVLLGSTAQKLLKLSPISILAVHQKCPSNDITLGFCCDLSPSNQSASTWSSKFATDLKSKMFIYSVLTPQVMIQDQGETDFSNFKQILASSKAHMEIELSAMTKKMGSNASFNILDGLKENIEDVIINQVEKDHVDLLFMGSHGRSGVSKWIMGSVTESVIDKSPCSIFIAK